MTAHIHDPVFDEKYVCDEVNFFEDAVNKWSEKACNRNKFKSLIVIMGQPHIPALSCHFESIISDKTLQDSSRSHSAVLSQTVTDSHPEMLMPPTGTVEIGPIAPSSNTN